MHHFFIFLMVDCSNFTPLEEIYMYRTKAIYQFSNLKQSSWKILRLFEIYLQSGSQAPVRGMVIHVPHAHTRAVRSTVIHMPGAHTMYGHTRAVRSMVIHVPGAHTMYGHTRAVRSMVKTRARRAYYVWSY